MTTICNFCNFCGFSLVESHVQQIQVRPSETPGGPVIASPVPAGVPRTFDELRALTSRRTELNDQLGAVRQRRSDLLGQLILARDPAARKGLEERMRSVDERIQRLESDIDLASDQIANAPPHVLAGGSRDAFEIVSPPELAGLGAGIGGNIVPLAGIISVFFLAPLAIAISRFIWKRAVAPPRPAIDHATQARLEQLQQAVDTIAIEVERISEGQRFSNKLLSELRPALGAGAAEPVRIAQKSIVNERG